MRRNFRSPIVPMNRTHFAEVSTHVPTAPKAIRILIAALGLLVIASTIWLGGTALFLPDIAPGQKVAWLLFGFEVVIFISGAIAILFGVGRFSSGPGLALACVAGTILLAAKFGAISANNQLGSVPLGKVILARAIIAGIIASAGAWCVLSRDRRSIRPALIGAACGLPVLVTIGAALEPGLRRKIESAVSASTTMTVVGVLITVVLAILLCASVHLLVRAFEFGRLDDQTP